MGTFQFTGLTIAGTPVAAGNPAHIAAVAATAHGLDTAAFQAKPKAIGIDPNRLHFLQ